MEGSRVHVRNHCKFSIFFSLNPQVKYGHCVQTIHKKPNMFLAMGRGGCGVFLCETLGAKFLDKKCIPEMILLGRFDG